MICDRCKEADHAHCYDKLRPDRAYDSCGCQHSRGHLVPDGHGFYRLVTDENGNSDQDEAD